MPSKAMKRRTLAKWQTAALRTYFDHLSGPAAPEPAADVEPMPRRSVVARRWFPWAGDFELPGADGGIVVKQISVLVVHGASNVEGKTGVAWLTFDDFPAVLYPQCDDQTEGELRIWLHLRGNQYDAVRAMLERLPSGAVMVDYWEIHSEGGRPLKQGGVFGDQRH